MKLIFTTILCACTSVDPSGGKRDQAPLAVSVTAAVPAPREEAVEVPGTLHALEEASLAAEVDARVAAVRVDLGATVRQGEALAVLLDEDYRLAVTRAEAEQQAAERELARTEKLLPAGMATEAELDADRARVGTATAAAGLARVKLERCTPRAPWDGVVAARYVSAGDYVRVGTPLFELVKLDPLRLRAEVPEAWAGQVAVGLPIEVVMDGGTAVRAALVRVGPAIATGSRTFPVEADIPNPKGALKAGAFARVRLLTGSVPEAVAVPARAVLTASGRSRAFEVVDGRAVEREVTVLAAEGEQAVVTGIAPGAAVAVRGAARLTDGASVQLETPAGDAAP